MRGCTVRQRDEAVTRADAGTSDPAPGQRTGHRWRWSLATLALLCLAAGGALEIRERIAVTDPDIVFADARLRTIAGRLSLDARAEIQLPNAVRQGLESGVPLDFIVELAVREPRRLWPDPLRAEARWRFRLVYYELTRHYRLGSSDSGRARNYRSVLSALDALGRLEQLDVGQLEAAGNPVDERGGEGEGANGRPLLATLRMRLDTGGLPLPLQPLIGTSWRVRSAPFTWQVPADGAPA